MPTAQKLKNQLKKKAERLLWESAIPGRQAFVYKFLEPALKCGRVGLVGGAIRDLAFQSIRQFSSDVDFVMSVEDASQFREFVSALGPSRNAFGGYRTIVGGLRVDFWEAKGSWAHTEGHCTVEHLEDVLQTTFFNLDALIFDVGQRQILAEEHVLNELIDRLLDVNLRPNPNEDGAAVRAIRRLWQRNLRASDKLIDFMAQRIAHAGWDSLIDRDRQAFPQAPIIGNLFGGSRPSPEKFSTDLKANQGWLLQEQQFELDFSYQQKIMNSSAGLECSGA